MIVTVDVHNLLSLPCMLLLLNHCEFEHMIAYRLCSPVCSVSSMLQLMFRLRMSKALCLHPLRQLH